MHGSLSKKCECKGRRIEDRRPYAVVVAPRVLIQGAKIFGVHSYRSHVALQGDVALTRHPDNPAKGCISYYN